MKAGIAIVNFIRSMEESDRILRKVHQKTSHCQFTSHALQRNRLLNHRTKKLNTPSVIPLTLLLALFSMYPRKDFDSFDTLDFLPIDYALNCCLLSRLYLIINPVQNTIHGLYASNTTQATPRSIASSVKTPCDYPSCSLKSRPENS